MIPRCLALYYAEGKEDFFDLNDNPNLPMPYAVVPGPHAPHTLLEAAGKLSGLKPGAVALQFGGFWVFWVDVDFIQDDAEFYDASPLIDMYEGCYLLLETGVWHFKGAS